MATHASSYVSTERWKVWGTTLLYALVVAIFSSFHEVWRDEVATLSLVTESHSLRELFSQLKYYGHPGLWHLLLYIGYHIFPQPIVIKIINLLICVAAVYLFLSKAPFSWGQKVLFIAGFFPLYLYPVFSRNYAISMLLVFAVAALYKDRWSRIVPLGLVLFLLANAHAHSFITAVAVGIALLVELGFFKAYRDVPTHKRGEIFLGFGIWALGLWVCLLQIAPPSDSIIFSGHRWTPLDVLKAVVEAVVIPGKYFSGIFGYDNQILVNVIIFSLYAYLWRKKVLLIMFAAGVIGLAMFFQLIFPSDFMRHQGAFYLLMIMVLWMDAFVKLEAKTARGVLGAWGNYLTIHKEVLLTFLLMIEVCMVFPALKSEIIKPYSSAQALARLVTSVPSLKEAIFVGVPESFLETLPYYLDNPIYFFSEQHFGKYRLFKTDDHSNFSLTDVLNAAQNLKVQYGKPVVIILGYQVTDHGPYSFSFNYKKSFTYSPAELGQFYGRTTLLAGFIEVAGDEKYRVFLLKS